MTKRRPAIAGFTIQEAVSLLETMRQQGVTRFHYGDLDVCLGPRSAGAFGSAMEGAIHGQGVIDEKTIGEPMRRRVIRRADADTDTCFCGCPTANHNNGLCCSDVPCPPDRCMPPQGDA